MYVTSSTARMHPRKKNMSVGLQIETFYCPNGWRIAPRLKSPIRAYLPPAQGRSRRAGLRNTIFLFPFSTLPNLGRELKGPNLIDGEATASVETLILERKFRGPRRIDRIQRMSPSRTCYPKLRVCTKMDYLESREAGAGPGLSCGMQLSTWPLCASQAVCQLQMLAVQSNQVWDIKIGVRETVRR